MGCADDFLFIGLKDKIGKIGLFKVRGFSYALKMGKLFKEKFPIYNRYNG